MEKKPHILTVDDEPDIRRLINKLLTANGYTVDEAQDGKTALAVLENKPDFDLIIMDIMMPEMTGTQASAKIRNFCTAPILFLTALTKESAMADAYKSGGDDFLSKPFSQSEFLLKVNSLVRRYRIYKGKKEEMSEDIALNDASKEVVIHGQSVFLTDTEYGIIKFLFGNKGKVVSVPEIYESVWNEKYLSSDANTVMVHILKLRKKTESVSKTPIIKTVWGKGYLID